MGGSRRRADRVLSSEFLERDLYDGVALRAACSIGGRCNCAIMPGHAMSCLFFHELPVAKIVDNEIAPLALNRLGWLLHILFLAKNYNYLDFIFVIFERGRLIVRR